MFWWTCVVLIARKWIWLPSMLAPVRMGPLDLNVSIARIVSIRGSLPCQGRLQPDLSRSNFSSPLHLDEHYACWTKHPLINFHMCWFSFLVRDAPLHLNSTDYWPFRARCFRWDRWPKSAACHSKQRTGLFPQEGTLNLSSRAMGKPPARALYKHRKAISPISVRAGVPNSSDVGLRACRKLRQGPVDELVNHIQEQDCRSCRAFLLALVRLAEGHTSRSPIAWLIIASAWSRVRPPAWT